MVEEGGFLVGVGSFCSGYSRGRGECYLLMTLQVMKGLQCDSGLYCTVEGNTDYQSTRSQNQFLNAFVFSSAIKIIYSYCNIGRKTYLLSNV